MLDENLYKTALNSMSAHVAILDETGLIVETNRAWQDFARENGMTPPFDSIGSNYLAICDSAINAHENGTGPVAEGIREVMSGKIPEFFTQYPCHSPNQKRWYALRVVPVRDAIMKRVIITHEEITPIMEVQEALKSKEAELLRQRERLEETNIALRVLLQQRDEDRSRIEETIFQNVNRLVQPYVEKLMQGRLTEKQRTLAEIIDTNLRDIVSPFIRRLSSLGLLLTPQELEVADMLRNGRTSKEMAEVLGLSVSGVDFHRKRLRKKLGLTNSAKNLRSHLLSLTDLNKKG